MDSYPSVAFPEIPVSGEPGEFSLAQSLLEHNDAFLSAKLSFFKRDFRLALPGFHPIGVNPSEFPAAVATHAVVEEHEFPAEIEQTFPDYPSRFYGMNGRSYAAFEAYRRTYGHRAVKRTVSAALPLGGRDVESCLKEILARAPLPRVTVINLCAVPGTMMSKLQSAFPAVRTIAFTPYDPYSGDKNLGADLYKNSQFLAVPHKYCDFDSITAVSRLIRYPRDYADFADKYQPHLCRGDLPQWPEDSPSTQSQLCVADLCLPTSRLGRADTLNASRLTQRTMLGVVLAWLGACDRAPPLAMIVPSIDTPLMRSVITTLSYLTRVQVIPHDEGPMRPLGYLIAVARVPEASAEVRPTVVRFLGNLFQRSASAKMCVLESTFSALNFELHSLVEKCYRYELARNAVSFHALHARFGPVPADPQEMVSSLERFVPYQMEASYPPSFDLWEEDLMLTLNKRAVETAVSTAYHEWLVERGGCLLDVKYEQGGILPACVCARYLARYFSYATLRSQKGMRVPAIPVFAPRAFRARIKELLNGIGLAVLFP